MAVLQQRCGTGQRAWYYAGRALGWGSTDDTETKILLDSPETWRPCSGGQTLSTYTRLRRCLRSRRRFQLGRGVAGQAAMFGLASWGTPTLIADSTFKWDVAPMAKGTGGSKGRLVRQRFWHYPRFQASGGGVAVPERVPVQGRHGVHVGRLGAAVHRTQVGLRQLAEVRVRQSTPTTIWMRSRTMQSPATRT